MKFENIDDYINAQDESIKERLFEIKDCIKSVNSEMIEKMSWQMPTFWLGENIIHFAVHKNHIGIYPGPEAIIHFEKELKKYKTSKGAIQIPNDEEFPFELIRKIVKYNLDN